jgi:pimeloyl-ACP methyl ester carboxylesterase
MQILRTRFKKEIVAEFAVPSRKSDQVIIWCNGMPSASSKKDILEFYARKGYWVIYPRYRGSWESDGQFLRHSPAKDIIDVIDTLPKGFKSFFDNKVYKVRPGKIILFGSSFGGPAGILASKDPRVSKVVALSPVVDWKAPSKAEPLDWVAWFSKQAFGNGYRFQMKDWKKLSTGKFYNPAHEADKLDGSKILIIHAKDDESVSYRSVSKFAGKTGSKLITVPRGGHLPANLVIKPKYYRIIMKFIRN